MTNDLRVRQLPNVVPSPKTRDVAHRMVRHAELETGYDAAIKYLNQIRPEQVPALVGVLLGYVKATRKPGRPPKPVLFSERERREGHRAYKAGERDHLTVARHREYQRVSQQRRRQRLGGVDEAYPLSDGRETMTHEGRRKSAPTGAGTPLAGALPLDRRTTDS